MKLRNYLLTGAAAASLAVVTSSSAANAAEAYASIFGGVNFLQNPGMSGTSHTSYYSYLTFVSSQSVDTSFKTGYVVGGNFGVDWQNGFRTELELALRGNSSKKSATLNTFYGYLYYGSGPYTLASTTNAVVPASIDLRAYSLMANAWYDFDTGTDFTPYVGGGVGMALVQISGGLNGFHLIEKNDTVFAWQVGAGVSMPINDTMKVFLDYRYFAADGAKLKIEPGFNGGDINADFDSSSVMVGLRFSL